MLTLIFTRNFGDAPPTIVYIPVEINRTVAKSVSVTRSSSSTVFVTKQVNAAVEK